MRIEIMGCWRGKNPTKKEFGFSVVKGNHDGWHPAAAKDSVPAGGGTGPPSDRSGAVPTPSADPSAVPPQGCLFPTALSRCGASTVPNLNPPPIHPDLAEVLFTGARIKRRVKSLAREIKAAYGDDEFTIISLINGAVMFTADLMREIDNPVRLDCIRVSSYGGKTKSIGTPQIVHSLTLDIRRRRVLLIDDILDTGKTLKLVSDLVRELSPASLRTCVLLDKKARREVPIEADFVGFEIPDKFVVGYGLDFAERYRNLPCIGVLRPDRQSTDNWAAG
jgi:hypoxanthine phosphoribosyltransferase